MESQLVSLARVRAPFLRCNHRYSHLLRQGLNRQGNPVSNHHLLLLPFRPANPSHRLVAFHQVSQLDSPRLSLAVSRLYHQVLSQALFHQFNLLFSLQWFHRQSPHLNPPYSLYLFPRLFLQASLVSFLARARQSNLLDSHHSNQTVCHQQVLLHNRPCSQLVNRMRFHRAHPLTNLRLGRQARYSIGQISSDIPSSSESLGEM